jgi:hypothetical protein
MQERYLCVDLHGMVLGSTYTTAPAGLYQATTSTGDKMGTVELLPFSWPRNRIRVSDLEPLVVKPIKTPPDYRGSGRGKDEARPSRRHHYGASFFVYVNT